MRISDWSSDVCSSDLAGEAGIGNKGNGECSRQVRRSPPRTIHSPHSPHSLHSHHPLGKRVRNGRWTRNQNRSEEHTSELQSLMRISYAVFCLKKKNSPHNTTYPQ